MELAITKTYLDSQFWQVLQEASSECYGPFDGACLICANALILAAGGGELVHIKSDLNNGQCEHYGALIDGVIYDFDGPCSGPDKWVTRFKKNERVYDRELSFSTGPANNSDILDDPKAVQQVAAILKKYM